MNPQMTVHIHCVDHPAGHDVEAIFYFGDSPLAVTPLLQSDHSFSDTLYVVTHRLTGLPLSNRAFSANEALRLRNALLETKIDWEHVTIGDKAAGRAFHRCLKQLTSYWRLKGEGNNGGIMRTIIIWDQCGEEPVSFFILDGDYTHLDRVYINQVNDKARERELNDLVYDDNKGIVRLKALEHFPELRPGDKVIVAGFLP